MHYNDDFEEEFLFEYKNKKNKVKKFKKDTEYIETKKEKVKKEISRKKERESKNFDI